MMEQTDLFAQPAFTAPFDHQNFIALLTEQEKLLHSDMALAKLLNESKIDDAFYLILLFYCSSAFYLLYNKKILLIINLLYC